MRNRLTDRVAKTMSLTGKLDRIASELETEYPHIALAIDQISDKLDGALTAGGVSPYGLTHQRGPQEDLSKYERPIATPKKTLHNVLDDLKEAENKAEQYGILEALKDKASRAESKTSPAGFNTLIDKYIKTTELKVLTPDEIGELSHLLDTTFKC